MGATAALWRRRDLRADAVGLAEVLVGLGREQLEDAVVLALAVSPEAGHLLDGMEVRVRTLTSATDVEPVRCVQAVRGPVLWSETAVARAGAAGSDDVFVCARTTRTFDTPENRVLVDALDHLRRAGPALHREVGARMDPSARRQVAAVVAEASSWRRHPRLDGVRTGRLGGRELVRLRRGHRSGQVAPLLGIGARMADPFTAEDVESLADGDHRRWHEEVVGLLDARGEPDHARLVRAGGWLQVGSTRFAGPGQSSSSSSG